MALTWKGYGSLVDANNYFEQRLHVFHWSNASAEDRIRANNQAYELINMFNYEGEKKAVYDALTADPDATEATLQAAWLTQDGEFPRGTSSVVPDQVIWAQYLISYGYLEGRVPEEEFEQLAILNQGDTIVRIKDIATVELGGEDYNSEVLFSGQKAVFMGMFVLPNANTVDVIRAVL